MSLKRCALLALAALAVAAMPATAAERDHKIDKIRAATAKYHHLPFALADGYRRASDCVEDPVRGGMGYHYVNEELVADRRIRPRKPEALLYEPRGGWPPRLVAVEYIRADADQDPGTDFDRPFLFGVPFDGPHAGHAPGEPLHYDLHAWVWKRNPAGMFAQFNPRVDCP